MLDEPTKTRIADEIKSQDVVLFMKGTPVFPQCGFSAALVGLLTHLKIPFKGVDVLEDESIRQGIKEFSNWPTIPQLYVKGEFIGGVDIVREMYEAGEFTTMLDKHGIKASAQAKTDSTAYRHRKHPA
ncbi:MAG: Grx4 family monothiol glutaredoxin [Proteobacteria bacterium]|nr:Grx4 family monothiol glutaredoxin [Pseudomonadota bacterium]